MTIREVVVAISTTHEPIPSGDTISPDAIPISSTSGNILVAKTDGLYVPFSGLPYALWDIGNSSQPNSGKGIDQDTYWQLDMSLHTGPLPDTWSITDEDFLSLPTGV